MLWLAGSCDRTAPMTGRSLASAPVFSQLCYSLIHVYRSFSSLPASIVTLHPAIKGTSGLLLRYVTNVVNGCCVYDEYYVVLSAPDATMNVLHLDQTSMVLVGALPPQMRQPHLIETKGCTFDLSAMTMLSNLNRVLHIVATGCTTASVQRYYSYIQVANLSTLSSALTTQLSRLNFENSEG